MHILITGGAGFIGSNLAAHALNSGHEVSIVDDLSTGTLNNLKGLDTKNHIGNINDSALMSRALKKVDSVVHLAALGSVPRSIQNPMATHLANATGTLAVLEASRNSDVEHVSCASSSSVYGMNPALPKNEREWVRPMSPYGVTKLATEQYTLAYQQSFGMKSTAFRFFNVFGPGQAAGHTYAAVIPVFLDALLKGQPIPINGDGLHSRDFTFVGSVCEVLLASAETRTNYAEPINLAFGTNTTLLELVSCLEDVTKLKAEILYREERAGDVRHSQADNTTLMSLFPDLEAVALQEGIAKTYAWFKDQI